MAANVQIVTDAGVPYSSTNPLPIAPFNSDGDELVSSSTVLSGASGFSLPSSGFSNPQYIGGTTVNDSTGFDVSPYASIITAYEGTYSGHTGTLQGTLDPTGATGWFPISAITVVPGGTNAPSSAVGTSGTAYSVPVAGIQRVRWSVTALSSGTIVVRVGGGAAFNEHQTAQVGAVGMAAHDAAVSGAPVRVGVKALTANATAVATGDTADLISTLVGALITKPYSIPEGDWTFAGATGGITDTTAVTLKTAGGAGIRNYLTGLQYFNSAAVASEIAIRDGAGGTVLWRGMVPASMTVPVSVDFLIPIRGTAATLLEVVMLTNATATRVSAQGFQAP
jgi:hypothetical protein